MRRLGFFGAALVSTLLVTACNSGGAPSVSKPASVGGRPLSTIALPQVDSGLEALLDPDAGTASPAIRIFITSAVQHAGNVTTYNKSGAQITPTITTDLDFPQLIAVDPSGKIFVANASETAFDGKVTTYKKSGVETTPKISNIQDLPT